MNQATSQPSADFWRAQASERQAEIDRLTVRVLALQKALGQAEAREANLRAPNLTSHERNLVAMFLSLPRSDRQPTVDRYTRDPQISGSLLSVLQFLVTA